MEHDTRLPASEPRKATPPASRRDFTGWALSGFAMLALSACGGGGGDGNDSDNPRQLLEVYNKLEDGMGPEDVTKLVGRVAGSIGGTAYLWQNIDESLTVHFNHKQGTQISGAYWYIGSSQSYSKLFKEV